MVPSEPELEACRQREIRREIEGHIAAAMAGQRRRDGEPEKLLDDVLERRLLLLQARHTGSFALSARTLEEDALPIALEAQDWPRFLRLAAIALRLRGLARQLCDKPILEALADAGRVELAQRLIDQLPSPVQRIRALALLAAARPESQEREILIRLSMGELDRLPRPQDRVQAEERCEALVFIVERCGLALADGWHAWLEALDGYPDLSRRAEWVWVKAHLEEGKILDSEVWSALHRLGREVYADRLPGALLRVRLRDEAELDQVLARISSGVEVDLRWPARLALLSAWISGGGAVAALRRHWRRCCAEETPARLEAGDVELARGVWAELSAQELDDLWRVLEAPAARLALVASQTAPVRLPGASPEALLDLVESVEDPIAQLDAVLSLLEARALGEDDHLVDQVEAHLRRRAFLVPDLLLMRFLGLLAKRGRGSGAGRRRLRGGLKGVFWSPAASAGLLRALVAGAPNEILLEELIAGAEAFSATVSDSESSGWELRNEVLIAAVCRLVEIGSPGSAPERTLERLAPDEQDSLRVAVARTVARGEGGDAETWLADVGDERLRIRSRIELSPTERRRSLLDPETLFRLSEDLHELADEVACMQSLVGPPWQLRAAAAEHLARVRSDHRRALGWVDLAWHGLAFQFREEHPLLRDPKGALGPLREGLRSVGRSLGPLALIEELIALSAPAGRRHAVAELREAVGRVLASGDLEWTARRDLLLALLARWSTSWEAFPDPPSAISRLLERWRLRSFFGWLLTLPDHEPHLERRKLLRERWQELLPSFEATARRLGFDPEKLRQDRSASEDLRCGEIAGEVPGPAVVASELPASERSACEGQATELAAGVETWRRWERAVVRGLWLPHPVAASGEPLDVADGSVEALCSLLSDPRWSPSRTALDGLRWGIWRAGSERLVGSLGRVFVGALARQGGVGPSEILRLWLQAYGAPRWGLAAPAARERLELAARALAATKSLGPSACGRESVRPDPEPAPERWLEHRLGAATQVTGPDQEYSVR